MVVAVPVVLMMQMSGYEIVDMVSVAHRFMAAIRSVLMSLVVASALMTAGAPVRVGRCDGDIPLPLSHSHKSLAF